MWQGSLLRAVLAQSFGMPPKQPGACLVPAYWCLMLTDLYGPEFVRPVIGDLFRGVQMGETCFHTAL